MKIWKIIALVFIVYSVLATVGSSLLKVRYVKNNRTTREFKKYCILYKDLLNNKLITISGKAHAL